MLLLEISLVFLFAYYEVIMLENILVVLLILCPKLLSFIKIIIIHQSSCSYTPSHNGIIDSNKMGIACTLLVHMKVPKHFGRCCSYNLSFEITSIIYSLWSGRYLLVYLSAEAFLIPLRVPGLFCP